MKHSTPWDPWEGEWPSHHVRRVVYTPKIRSNQEVFLVFSYVLYPVTHLFSGYSEARRSFNWFSDLSSTIIVGGVMYFNFYKDRMPKIKIVQLTLDDFLKGLGDLNSDQYLVKAEQKIITLNLPEDESISKYYNNHFKVEWLCIPKLPNFPATKCSEHYTTFMIPKKSGGLRKIDAPDDELKEFLKNMKDYFENVLKILPSEPAHAYVQTRSTVTAVKEHQKNESKWFLKMDLKDFFPSHNLQYTMKVLETIYPLNYLLKDTNYKLRLTQALEYAFLNGYLPQGTPLSPTLTNILMIPLDYEIQHMVWNQHFKGCYTRYADDILISSPYKFDFKKVETNIINTLTRYGTPFRVNQEKTRFGSANGRNWNLGIMLNKDNRMTIGHKANQNFRSMLNHIMLDYKNGIVLSNEDKMIIQGQISYYKMVDPEYTNTVIKRYEQKHDLKLKVVLKIIV